MLLGFRKNSKILRVFQLLAQEISFKIQFSVDAKLIFISSAVHSVQQSNALKISLLQVRIAVHCKILHLLMGVEFCEREPASSVQCSVLQYSAVHYIDRQAV